MAFSQLGFSLVWRQDLAFLSEMPHCYRCHYKYFICSFSETWKVKESEVELNATLQILWKVCPTWPRAKSSQLAGEQKVLFSLKDEI